MTEQRLANGVKARHDGAGGPFGMQHRTEFGQASSGLYMLDIDAWQVALGNSEDSLYAEYVLDPKTNAASTSRRIAYLAMFDVKQCAVTTCQVEDATVRTADMRATLGEPGKLSRDVYRDIAKKLSAFQPWPCRLFLVQRMSEKSWTMLELDIWRDGAVGVPQVLVTGQWHRAWAYFGLLEYREKLRQWLATPESEPAQVEHVSRIARYEWTIWRWHQVPGTYLYVRGEQRPSEEMRCAMAEWDAMHRNQVALVG